jgi:hypothetical protein
VVQAIEHQPSKWKAQRSNPSTAKRKKSKYLEKKKNQSNDIKGFFAFQIYETLFPTLIFTLKFRLTLYRLNVVL